jgi:hypothetical protein
MVAGVAKPRRRKQKPSADERGEAEDEILTEESKGEIDLEGIESLRQIWDITLLVC